MPRRPARVLVVEDDDDVRQIYSHWLRVSGFEVTEAGDGTDAMEMINGGAVPDVIVLDLMLPTLDGAAVRHELAARAETARIPVIVITALMSDVSALNVASVLRKPVTFESLVAAVRTASLDAQL
jgi:CheY-like chemotaxis protein